MSRARCLLIFKLRRKYYVCVFSEQIRTGNGIEGVMLESNYAAASWKIAQVSVPKNEKLDLDQAISPRPRE